MANSTDSSLQDTNNTPAFSKSLDSAEYSTSTESPTSLGNQQVENNPHSADKLKTLSLGDFLEGLTQISALGVIEATDIIEATHRELILRPFGRFNNEQLDKWQRGITAKVYKSIRGVTKTVGHYAATPLERYNQLITPKRRLPLPSSSKLVVSAINGVMGDELVTHQNVLALPMRLYDRYGHLQSIPSANPISGQVVILVHGLCMSHECWQVCEPQGLGERISYAQPDTTVFYLDFNTGRRIFENGQALSALLQSLVDNNPDITQIDLIGHSMGGLVSRSAIFYGDKGDATWVNRVGNLVTLGTPHDGAILEQIGHFIQEIVVKIPFAGAISGLVNIRSKGINDLRHGNIIDKAWAAITIEDDSLSTSHAAVPLPNHINAYCIASTLIEGVYHSKLSQLLGDGLVVAESALGEHEGEQVLNIPENHKAVFHGVSHLNLIYNDKIHDLILTWLETKNDNNNDGNEKESLGNRIVVYSEELAINL